MTDQTGPYRRQLNSLRVVDPMADSLVEAPSVQISHNHNFSWIQALRASRTDDYELESSNDEDPSEAADRFAAAREKMVATKREQAFSASD